MTLKMQACLLNFETKTKMDLQVIPSTSYQSQDKVSAMRKRVGLIKIIENVVVAAQIYLSVTRQLQTPTYWTICTLFIPMITL